MSNSGRLWSTAEHQLLGDQPNRQICNEWVPPASCNLGGALKGNLAYDYSDLMKMFRNLGNRWNRHQSSDQFTAYACFWDENASQTLVPGRKNHKMNSGSPVICVGLESRIVSETKKNRGTFLVLQRGKNFDIEKLPRPNWRPQIPSLDECEELIVTFEGGVSPVGDESGFR